MSRLSTNLEKWLTEIIIVVVGITIAFFVENYRSSREGDARYRSHLKAIHKDLVQDSSTYRTYVNGARIRVKRIDSLYALIEQHDRMRDKLLLVAFLQAFDIYKKNDDAFSAFQGSEGLATMNNVGLRDSLITYYHNQAFLEFLYDEQFKWMHNELFVFTDHNLHPADRKFDRYWYVAAPFDSWPDNAPLYKSNLKEFHDIVVLNFAKRCRDFHYYIPGAIEAREFAYNDALRRGVLRELNK